MTTLKLAARIPATPLMVYDFVTRPARWHEWHPASLGAQEHALVSLRAGTKFEEDIRSAGFKRRLRWEVLDSQPGQRWEASALMGDGSTVHLLYEFSADGKDTQFVRTLNYSIKPLVLRWLNDLIVWRKVQKESGRALENLRKHFSHGPR